MTKKEEFEKTAREIEESWDRKCGSSDYDVLRRLIVEALQKAVETEREECASLAENFPQLSNGYVIETDIAKAIRERQKGKL